MFYLLNNGELQANCILQAMKNMSASLQYRLFIHNISLILAFLFGKMNQICLKCRLANWLSFIGDREERERHRYFEHHVTE